MGLLILGLQQSAVWGWDSIGTWACLAGGAALMAVFTHWELNCTEPLLDLRIFKSREFTVDNFVLAAMSIVFVPFFFFASVYAQVSLAKSSSNAGLYIMWFFLGFVIMAQVGGRMLDRRGARPPIVIGCAMGAVGFYLLAGKLTDLSLGKQIVEIMIAGGGLGLILGPASTDAVNRAARTSYSEVTGITQTTRNFGASVGMAVLGTILITRTRTNVATGLTNVGVPPSVAHGVASHLNLSPAYSGQTAHEPAKYVHAVQLAFAQSTQTVFHIMAGVMAVTFFIAVRFLKRSHQPEAVPDERGAGEFAH